MPEKPQQQSPQALKDFTPEGIVFETLPLFYRKLERYTDDMATVFDVPDLNMMPADLYQTSKVSIGFFFKKAAHIDWEEDKLIFKQK